MLLKSKKIFRVKQLTSAVMSLAVLARSQCFPPWETGLEPFREWGLGSP